jgi:hypothetical protein
MDGKKRIAATITAIVLLLARDWLGMEFDEATINSVVLLILGLVVGDSIRPTLKKE